MSMPVLVNEQAARGTGRLVLDRAILLLKALGAQPELVTADSPAALVTCARELVASGPERVIVVGGDGTIHTLLPALAETNVTVGLLPLGTGNDFVRGLGLPSGDMETAVEAALEPPVAVDLGLANDRWFASVATLGFPTRVNARANRLRWPKGSRRYTVATLLEIGRLAPVAISLSVDGERHDVKVTMVAAANTAFFGGGMRVCPAADATDGLLDITVLGPTGRIELLRFLPTVFGGKHLGHSAVSTLRGREVTIEPAGDSLAGTSSAEEELWADGELLLRGTVTLTVRPGALRVAGAFRAR